MLHLLPDLEKNAGKHGRCDPKEGKIQSISFTPTLSDPEVPAEFTFHSITHLLASKIILLFTNVTSVLLYTARYIHQTVVNTAF